MLLPLLPLMVMVWCSNGNTGRSLRERAQCGVHVPSWCGLWHQGGVYIAYMRNLLLATHCRTASPKAQRIASQAQQGKGQAAGHRWGDQLRDRAAMVPENMPKSRKKDMMKPAVSLSFWFTCSGAAMKQDVVV